MITASRIRGYAQTPGSPRQHAPLLDWVDGRLGRRYFTARITLRVRCNDHDVAESHYQSGLGLLRNLQSVVDFDAQAANSALELRVAEQQLHSPKVSSLAIDQGDLRPPTDPAAQWTAAPGGPAFYA